MKKLILLCSLAILSWINAQSTTYYARATGNWNVAATWSTSACGGSAAAIAPTLTDDVVICPGYTVTINATASCANITVQNTGILQWTAAGPYILTVSGSISVASGGAFNYNGTSGTTYGHTLALAGNFTNSGTVDFYNGTKNYASITFNGATVKATIGGSGAWDLYSLTLNKTNKINELEITAAGFYTAFNSGSFTFTKGTYTHNNSASWDLNSTSDFTLNSNCILNATAGTLNIASAGNNLNLNSKLNINGGTVVVGSAAGSGGIRTDLITAGIYPEIVLSSGTLTVKGGITYNTGAAADGVIFNMSGGTLNVNTGSTGTSTETFNITDVAASSFTMSSGSIIIQKKTSGAYSDFSFCGTAGTTNVTAGTVQFGNSSTTNGTAFTFTPYTNATLPNLKITGAISSGNSMKPFASGNVKALSIYIDNVTSFDISHNANATDSRMLTLTGTMDGTYVWYNANTGNTADYISRNSTVDLINTGAIRPNTYVAYGVEFWNLNCAASSKTTTIYYGFSVDNVLTTGGGILTADAPSTASRSVYLRGAVSNPMVIGAGTTFSLYAIKFYGTSVTQNIPAYTYGCYLNVSGNGTTASLQGVLTCNGLYVHGDGLLSNAVTFNSNNYAITLLGAGNMEVGINTASTVTGAKTINLGSSLVDMNGTVRVYKGGTLNAATSTIKAGGDWVNINGTFNNGTGTVMFDKGNAGKTITNSNGETFYNLTMNKSATDLDITLNNSITVSNTLTMIMGDIVLGSNDLKIASGASVTGASSNSYIQANGSGVERKYISSVGAFTYDIGDASSYTKMVFTLNSATLSSADIALRLSPSKHPLAQGNHYLKRYWILTATGVTNPNYNTVCYYAVDATDVYGTEAYIKFYKYSGASWFQCGMLSTTANTLTCTGLTSFSDYTGMSGSVLPIQLESFTAQYNDIKSQTVINWKTASETNNDFFTVERSRDGEYFDALTDMDGQGMSVVETNYKVEDAHPLQGLSYYRLKQTDFDGTVTYSHIRAVNTPLLTKSFQIYPNPNPGDAVNIETGFVKDQTFQLLDVCGNLIPFTTTYGRTGLSLVPVKLLSPGVYIIRQTTQGVSQVLKFIVE